MSVSDRVNMLHFMRARNPALGSAPEHCCCYSVGWCLPPVHILCGLGSGKKLPHVFCHGLADRVSGRHMNAVTACRKRGAVSMEATWSMAGPGP
ncbi:hypothetical protein HaLaN_01149, partial [Haematococcus lacustris]